MLASLAQRAYRETSDLSTDSVFCTAMRMAASYPRHLFRMFLLLIGMNCLFYLLLLLHTQVVRLERPGEPSLEHEEIRHTLESRTDEFWSYISHQVNDLRDPKLGGKRKEEAINNILEEAKHMHWTIKNDLNRLAASDKADTWRKRQLIKLGKIVQKQLYKLQNPMDCSRARRLVVPSVRDAGLGSHMHSLAMALMVALRKQRTLVVNHKGWIYDRQGRWDKVFLPLSDTCKSTAGATFPKDGHDEDVQALQMPYSMVLDRQLSAYALPRQLALRVRRVHRDPPLWWMGQVIRFIMRPSPELSRHYAEVKKRINFTTPVVGIHIRRTDKLIREARFYNVSAYMDNAENFFRYLDTQGTVATRRVLIATDDPSAVSEARKKYPNYQVLHNGEASNSSFDIRGRYSLKNAFITSADFFLLADSDYLVCTLSSNVGRVAYSLLQTRSRDFTGSITSLDTTWTVFGHPRQYEAILPETRGHYLNFKVGDVITIHRAYHRRGELHGSKSDSNVTNWFPAHKVRLWFGTYESPLFRDEDFDD